MLASDSSPQQREAIGGWLLLICIVLVPHILNSALILAKSPAFLRDAGVDLNVGVEAHRLVMLSMNVIGNATGLILIAKRHRFTPAFFTIFIPLACALFFLDPDPIQTVKSYAQRIGFTYSEAPASFIVHATISFGSSTLILGYWMRSERVRRTFGSNGLEILRRRPINPAADSSV